MDKFNYENTEVKTNQYGGKILRNVSIKNGKGYKSISKIKNGKKIFTSKRKIKKKHINLIKKGIFIPGLFLDCKDKTCKNR